MTNSLEAITPVSPATPYIGGKRLLAKRLVQRINATPHVAYAEPFVGMGGVFLRRTFRPRAEIINDLNGEVANFFRILQRHPKPFLEMMRFQLTARSEFDRLLATDPSTLTDLERAFRFFYLQRTCFGGRVTQRSFGVFNDARSAAFNPLKTARVIDKLHERMCGVTIEALPYQEFIKRYDQDGILFYLDPPYWGSESHYGKDCFTSDDFVKMATQLASIKGQFILSLNDTPEIRDVFAGFAVEEVCTTYSIIQASGSKAGELIISKT